LKAQARWLSFPGSDGGGPHVAPSLAREQSPTRVTRAPKRAERARRKLIFPGPDRGYVDQPSPIEDRKSVNHRTRVIAVANQKGGVGKSTTAVSLGAALAELGKRVLVVDLDPQGNASTGLGIRHDARSVTVYEVLGEDAPITEAIVQTPVPNLYGVPSTIDLAGAEIELVSHFSRELKLRKAFEPLWNEGFDFVFLDCPPSLGLLTVNALAAAEELLVPIQCEYYALEGLGQLIKNVRMVQQNVNPSLRLTGIVMTMFDPRTKLSEQVVEEVRRYFGDRVYETIIPRTVRLSEAPGFGQPITVYDPRSRGAKRYRELAKEVLAKEPGDEPIPVPDRLPSVVVPPPEAQRPMSAPRPLKAEVSMEAAADEPKPLETGNHEARESSDENPAPAFGEVDGRRGPEPPTEGRSEYAPLGERPEAAQAPVEVDGPLANLDFQPNVESVEVGQGNEEGTEELEKRRWSLFRRGGDR
jgi:chromosome partitioning protein